MSDGRQSDDVTPEVSQTTIELTVVGLHPDGEHLVLRAAGNARFLVPIDEKLTAAVRGDRARLELLQSSSSLSPRDIQSRVRAGETAEVIARDSGMPIGQIQRLERPVLAERDFIAKQARKARVGSSPDAPQLGDLVTDRLAARDVNVTELVWDAVKVTSAGWRVSVTFNVGGTTKDARWSFEPRAQVLKALDDESRWLSETKLADEPIPNRRHLAAVRDEPFDIDSAHAAATSARPATDDATHPLASPTGTIPVDFDPANDPIAPVVPLTPTAQIQAVDTDALLDNLAARRGTRQGYDPDPTPNEDSPTAHVYSLPPESASVWSEDAPTPVEQGSESTPSLFDLPSTGRAPRADSDARESETSVDEPVAHSPAISTGTASPQSDESVVNESSDPVMSSGSPRSGNTKTARGNRKSRSQMPTWDEIVFGAKPE